MKALFNAWTDWVASLDASWLFVVILAFVVAVVWIWSSSLRFDKDR